MYATETTLWAETKRQLEKKYLPIRLENAAATSVPDAIIVGKRHCIWLELKIFRSSKTTMSKFQYAFGQKLVAASNPNSFWILAAYKDNLIVINYKDILGKLKAVDESQHLSLNLTDVPYDDIGSILSWMDRLMGQ